MAVRDPQTGRFVAGDDLLPGVQHSYDAFDIQNVKVTMQGHQDLSSGNTLFEQFHSIEPLGGLGRNEVAELVALLRTYDVAPLAAGNAPGHLQTQWELSFDSSAHYLGQADDGDEVSDDDNVDSVTGLDREVADSVDVDVLAIMALGESSSYEDATNGTGGSGGPTSMTDHRLYRSWFGAGPTVDRHDELFYHAWLNTDGAASSRVTIMDQYIWDVVEVD